MIERILSEGLKKTNKEATLQELGDRSKYIGSSDVPGCMRKTVMEKLNPDDPGITTLLRYERGHMVEKILKKALDAMNVRYEYQHEVTHPDAPLKAHLDFLFHSNDTEAILECKSVSGIPSAPYEDWITQLHYQMGLLAMEKRDKKIRGAILALDLNTGQRKVFNGYQLDLTVFGELVKNAEEIWSCVCCNEDDQKLRTQKGPLCAWCNHRPGCSAFKVNEDIPEVPIEEDVQNYLAMKETAKQLDKKIKELSVMIKAVIKNNTDHGKIKVGDYVASLSQRKRTGLDDGLLKKEMSEIHKKFTKTLSYEVLLIN